MPVPRVDAAAMALSNGDALLLGGLGQGGFQRTAEIYHWATDSWSAAGEMIDAPGAPNAVGLADGRVLVVGGATGQDPGADAPQLYDPASNRWYLAGVEPVVAHDSSLFLLPGGNVMAAGGGLYATGGGTEGGSVLFATQIYTPGPTPTLSAPAVQSVGQTTATVSGTYEMSPAHVQSCQVFYGISASYTHSAPCGRPAAGTPGTGGITALLSGLNPGATYHYQVYMSDGAVIATTTDQTFTTLPTPTPTQTTPPTTTTQPKPPTRPKRACIVPRVTGLRLAVARRVLRHAGCTVGKLTKTSRADTATAAPSRNPGGRRPAIPAVREGAWAPRAGQSHPRDRVESCTSSGPRVNVRLTPIVRRARPSHFSSAPLDRGQPSRVTAPGRRPFVLWPYATSAPPKSDAITARTRASACGRLLLFDQGSSSLT